MKFTLRCGTLWLVAAFTSAVSAQMPGPATPGTSVTNPYVAPGFAANQGYNMSMAGAPGTAHSAGSATYSTGQVVQQPVYPATGGVVGGQMMQAGCNTGDCYSGTGYQLGYSHPTPAIATGPLPGGAVPTSAFGGMATVAAPTVPPVYGEAMVDGGCAQEMVPMMSPAYDMAMSSSWSGSGCCAPAPAPVAPTWFGGVYGLIMDRDDGSDFPLLYDNTVANRAYLYSSDAEMEFSGGYEVRIGRTFNCGAWGLEAVYWELFPDSQQASISLPQTPAPAMYYTTGYANAYLNYSGGFDTIANLYPTVYAARIQRDFDFQNIEVNLISRPLFACGGFRAGRPRSYGPGYAGVIGSGTCYPGTSYGPSIGGNLRALGIGGKCAGCGQPGCGGGCGGCVMPTGPACAGSCGDPCGCNSAMPYACSGGTDCACPPRLMIGWMFGVRYFKFDEGMRIDYDSVDAVYDGADPDTEFTHISNVENDLVGVQLGLNLDYYLTKCLALEAGSRFGLYGNHMRARQRIYNGYGDAYYLPASPTNINTNVDDEDVAFLGELRVGLASKIGCHWRLAGGYRALAASGVALSTNQFPYGSAGIGTVGSGVNRNGDLILHGAYSGIEFAW